MYQRKIHFERHQPINEILWIGEVSFIKDVILTFLFVLSATNSIPTSESAIYSSWWWVVCFSFIKACFPSNEQTNRCFDACWSFIGNSVQKLRRHSSYTSNACTEEIFKDHLLFRILLHWHWAAIKPWANAYTS